MGHLGNMLIGGALALTMALPAWAEQRVAVLIANEDYDNYRDVSEATDIFALSRVLRAEGFSISAHRNLDAASMRKVAARIADQIERGDRVVVAVSGHVVSSESDSWLFAVDATPATALGAGLQGLSLNALADLMGGAAGSGVLLVGEAGAPISARGGLTAGLGNMDLPQGVTAFAANTSALVRWADQVLLSEGTSLAAALAAGPRSLRGYGFLSVNAALVPATASQGISGVSASELDDFFFDRARTAGTQGALEGYLSRYPGGLHAPEARQMIADLARSPEDVARDEEQALRLSRADRRGIQADLTLLGYSTNGIDGIFGNGTRNAVRRWEAASRLEVTGFLNADDLEILAAQAAAERKKIEREDAAYWRSTGQLDTEAGYHTYLDRYPDGLFSKLAREQLASIEDARLVAEREDEQNAWDVARAKDTVAEYQSFLAEFPDGANAAAAEDRIAALQAANAETTIDQARDVEIKLLANPITRVLVERRLAQLGFDPGKIDGKFNKDARRAVRQFQKARGLPITGYFNAQSLGMLLSN